MSPNFVTFVTFNVMDVTNDPDILAGHVLDAEMLVGGPIDCLLYTAGCGQRTQAVETSAEGHRRLMATNFEGAVALSRAVLPSMLESSSGNIVVVSSVQGFFGQPGRTSYAASKAAVVGYFDSLRAEVAPSGVKVMTGVHQGDFLGNVTLDSARKALAQGKPIELRGFGVTPPGGGGPETEA